MSQESLDNARTLNTAAAATGGGGGPPAPDEPGGRIYTSAGTIRVQVSVEKTDATIFFVPDNHHVVRHGSKSYAVFVSCNDNPCAVLHDLEKDCCINVTHTFSGFKIAMTSAAVGQCKVEINVKKGGADKQLTLTSITVPAKRDK